VHRENLDGYLRHLRLTLDKLRVHQLYAKRSKCQFSETTVDNLGHIISAHSFFMEDENVNAIQTWTTPQSKKDVLSYIGVVNFYRRFIINMENFALPLIRLSGNLNFECTAARKRLSESERCCKNVHQYCADSTFGIPCTCPPTQADTLSGQYWRDGQERSPVTFFSRFF